MGLQFPHEEADATPPIGAEHRSHAGEALNVEGFCNTAHSITPLGTSNPGEGIVTAAWRPLFIAEEALSPETSIPAGDGFEVVLLQIITDLGAAGEDRAQEDLMAEAS